MDSSPAPPFALPAEPTPRATLRLVDGTAPRSIPVQPMPIVALVAPTPDGNYTAVARKFHPGESARCRLCPDGGCIAVEDVCQLLIPGVIGPEEALLYSTLGLPRVRHRGAGTGGG